MSRPCAGSLMLLMTTSCASCCNTHDSVRKHHLALCSCTRTQKGCFNLSLQKVCMASGAWQALDCSSAGTSEAPKTLLVSTAIHQNLMVPDWNGTTACLRFSQR